MELTCLLLGSFAVGLPFFWFRLAGASIKAMSIAIVAICAIIFWTFHAGRESHYFSRHLLGAICVTWFFLLAASATALGSLARRKAVEPPPISVALPEVEIIDRVSVSWEAEAAKLDSREILSPREFWADVRSALIPCEYDPHPYQWPVLARLELSTTDSQKYHIVLYVVGDCYPAAFSLRAGRGRAVHCRGGSMERLRRILDAQQCDGMTASRDDEANRVRLEQS